MLRTLRIALLIFAALAIMASRSASAAAMPTYLALGDSMAFGETDFTHNPSNADRGYVSLFANHLATLNGGARPAVINLGVDAETSTTFLQGGTQGDGTQSGFPAPQLNTNYATPTPTQHSLLQAILLTQNVTGHSIDTVSVQLGANDLFVLANSPGFLALTPIEQQTQVAATLGTFQANYTTLLTELKTALPNATLLMLGYHNPFGGIPGHPLSAIAGPAIQALNGLIEQDAAAFGGRYVDTYTQILGHELDYTLIANGNVHPNDAGYALIAAQMEAQTVPEPSTLVVLGAGLVGFLVHDRRRKAAIS
ncbi:GDSL-type esterase/lipase family protein [Singulisphaera sp. Ch08]|uniref:GDSL-type esterase/lipase family protein n=1 Tax=Singulisphaera sp. Ch08 TaxID=3120278 RepID=A0AAU7C9D1_9BACT